MNFHLTTTSSSSAHRSADCPIRETIPVQQALADSAVRAPANTNELLLLPDGRVLVHNLTPEMARVLAELNPADPQLAPRALTATEHATQTTSHELPD
jgi:hypothetical protein